VTDRVLVWRYALHPLPKGGWAKILLDSTGIFAAVSDWGNYAFVWSAWKHGQEDFRTFVAELEKDPDYAAGKLMFQRVSPKERAHARAFCDAVLPALAKVIRAELEVEAEGLCIRNPAILTTVGP